MISPEVSRYLARVLFVVNPGPDLRRKIQRLESLDYENVSDLPAWVPSPPAGHKTGIGGH